MLSVHLVLVLIAFGLTLVSGITGITGKVPLWIPLLLVCITLLVGGVVR